MALQMGSPSNSWSQAVYGHTSLQFTLMAETQLHTQVFSRILNPRIKFLMWVVEAKVCPDKSLQKWVERLTFLSLSISTSPCNSGARANRKLKTSGILSNPTVSMIWPRQIQQERSVPSHHTGSSPGPSYMQTLTSNVYLKTELFHPQKVMG